MSQIKVRNCPSPTWNLHIWTLRTALYNYLFAKKNNWKIVFRSEDTDRERSTLEYENNIVNWLKKMWIWYDEWIFRQSERWEIYKKYIEKLLESWDAYYCFMTKSELDEIRTQQINEKKATRYPNTYRDFDLKKAKELLEKWEKAVIRLKLPDKEIVFNDLIKWEIKIHTKELWWDMVIARSVDQPLYNFAVVIDDIEMWITHVLRWEDWISNTPKQICIYEKILWENLNKMPKFWHFPLILNEDKTKLSKRKNKVSVQDFLDEWYLPEALLNFIALIWWSPKNEDEFFTLDELIERFSLEWVSKSWAIFDIKKLDFINAHYIKNLSLEEFEKTLAKDNWKFLWEKILELKNKNFSQYKKILKFAQSRIKKFSEINSEIKIFFDVENFLDNKNNFDKNIFSDFKENILFNKKMWIWEENIKEILENLKIFINWLEDWFLENTKNLEEKILQDEIKTKIIEFIKSVNSKNWMYMRPLRASLSREVKSASPFEIMPILGKVWSIERIDEVLRRL